MGLPKTYLFTAPSDALNTFGEGMHHRDFIKGLKRCNGRIVVPLPEHYTSMGWKLHPEHSLGHTSIWLGPPPSEKLAIGAPKYKGGKKITSFHLTDSEFHLGVIPEWTQVGPKGAVIARGWRDILKRCIDARAFTKRKAERVFRVKLDADEKDKLCFRCRREGVRAPATCANGLCDDHDFLTWPLAKRTEFTKYMLSQDFLKGANQTGYTGKEKEIVCS